MKHMTLILLTVFLFTLMLPLHGRTAVKIHKMVLIPGGTFRMGDHHDLGGREHGNDEVPIHSVQLDAFHIGAFEITNTQYCRFLNKALLNKAITLDSKGRVYDKNGKFLLCDTHKSDNACDIKWAAESFVVFKNRGRHPAVCIRWHGAVAYCNLMSRDAGYSPCYNTETWECDITKNGYRLPGEAEWEYAGRGGAVSPYRIFPWGDTADTARANWPNSGDPFEYGAYPGTTPVGFYNGDIRYKKDFNWPGKQMLFQTSSGANGYGLYDMSGNVWEWVNDWYSLGYYKNSPRKNPTGPKKGQAMKDGKPYRTLRGGSWYNGQWGHGRVSNRNPSYYRGPEDPFHRWYHIGFRVARTASASEALASAVVSHKTTRMDIPTGESTQTKPYISPDNRSQMRTGNRPQTQRTQADGSSKRQRTRRETSGNNQQRKGRFEEMDVDNSGFVTLDEMLAHETEKFNSRNTQSNIKGERSFSLDQYLEDEKRKFLEMDTNGDNQLSKEEVETSERRRGSEKGNRSNTKRGQAGNNGSNYDQRGQAGNNGSNYDQRGQAGNYESNYNQRGQADNNGEIRGQVGNTRDGSNQFNQTDSVGNEPPERQRDNSRQSRQDGMTDQNRGGSGRQSRFDEMDTDKNGFATLDEMLAHETEKFNNRNTRSNGNSQGNISLAQHLENEKEKFLKMDADGDTQLSKAETEQGESAGKRQERRSTSDEQTRGRQRNKENRQTTYKSPGRRATGRLKPGAAATGVTLGLEGLSGGDIGLVKNSSQAYPGYTLFAPKHRTMTYLIDNAGRVVHEWTGSKYEPGQTVYLLPNGNLLRCCFVHGHGLTRGGEGGRLEEYDWDGKLVWEFDYASDKYMLHHDIAILPNGNILALAVEKKSYKECIDAGFAPRMVRDTELYPDFVVEIEPTRPGGGKIVWEWHVWDHLIQDYAPNKQNYGNVAAHPERVYTHCNGRPSQAFWNHMNSIAYNEKLDQIMLSVRGCSEIWVIDHSTTAKQAAGRLGGKYGKGGDLLYRWGNPSAYKNGSSGTAARQLFDQHDAHWIPEGCPGAGNILVFNNGLERGYSSVMELVPPLDEKGNYSHGVSGRYGPVNTVWEYSAENGKRFYSSEISGAHRLPNGNTLICAGVLGVFFEVTPAGKTVWKYVNPVVRGGTLAQGELPGTDHRGHYLNAVFKVHRYALDYQGIKDKNTVPGKAIELPISQKGKTGLDGKSDVMRRTSNSRKRNKKYDKLRSLGYIN